MTTLPEDQRLAGISPKAYEHPADRAAIAALAQVPLLDQVVRKLIEFGYERALRQVFMGGSVKLGPDQIPNAWAAHRAALARRLPGLRERMVPNAGLWIAWPKRTSGMEADLTEDVVRELALANALVDNKVCAIDATWSGLRLVIRLRDR